MSARYGGLGEPISKSGQCDREVYVGSDKRIVRHKWRLTTRHGEEGVRITTELLHKTNHNRVLNKLEDTVENSQLALSVRGEEMAADVLQNTRDKYNKAQQQQPGGGGSSSGTTGKRSDMEIFCPIMTALRGGLHSGRQTRSGTVTNQPAEREVRHDSGCCQSTTRFKHHQSCVGAANCFES